MLPLLQARVTVIFSTLGQYVVSVTPLAVNFNSFKLKITLTDGSTLRLNESYRDNNLEKYAYYWLDAHNELIIGSAVPPKSSKFPGVAERLPTLYSPQIILFSIFVAQVIYTNKLPVIIFVAPKFPAVVGGLS